MGPDGLFWSARALVIRVLCRAMRALGDRPAELADVWAATYVSRPEEELQRIDKILDVFRVDTKKGAVDVGANYGVWTRQLVRRFPRVMAVEANPALARIVQSYVGVETLNVAVTASGGRASLWVPSLRGQVLTGWGSLDPKNCPVATSLEQIAVTTRTLDDVTGSRDIGFVKIDIEGQEAHALRGAPGLLTRQRPVVLVEIKPANMTAVQAVATEHSYGIAPSRSVLGDRASDEMYILFPLERAPSLPVSQ